MTKVGMKGRVQPQWGLCLLIVVGLASAVSAMPYDEALRARPMCGDAQLADVCFVDTEHGWAVGDRGTIWHTVDGGRHWSLQPSGVDCRLSSVVFLDRKIGWAAGGSTQPYTHVSLGVVLRTQDGGEHWTQEQRAMTPAIARIGFFDPLRGWALGQPSALFPSGVLTTEDGGRTWAAMPATQSRGWLTGALIDPNTGALAGRTSALATIRRRGLERQPADFGLRALRAMQLAPPAKGWLVGDGGLVLQTRDLGKSWQTTEGLLPPGARDHFDFHALAARGPHCWVAGTPGTRVFHSPDDGRTWTAADTGQPLPIRALSFVDEQMGWAVGDLGTILATVDGGQTWHPQARAANAPRTSVSSDAMKTFRWKSWRSFRRTRATWARWKCSRAKISKRWPSGATRPSRLTRRPCGLAPARPARRGAFPCDRPG